MHDQLECGSPRRRDGTCARWTTAFASLTAGVALALAAGCGGGSGAGSATGVTTARPPAHSLSASRTKVPPTGNSEIDGYLHDVGSAASALGEFSQALADAGIGSGLQQREHDLRAVLARFDGAMINIARRQLPYVPSIIKQRGRIQQAGRRLTASLLRFVEAAASGDVSTVQSLLPDVTGRIDDFRAATVR